ncbi:hypothetical protein NBT05_06475 [Aquimarina sp. ERC-38]|uniref:hypothetical protein n=1 Tax=Aquimarina sp. ERC-38 TaxID=2949996 RepID=UPI0022459F9B|nr:hypothetical protein [Aquimarina sp. ERC-38]UZO82113.1 hypothetical protein NBT05_06475 [Aquimarina sp. ERC-38]
MMTKIDLIKEFEIEVSKIKEECLKRLKSETVIKVIDKFQKEVAESFTQKINYSIFNNIEHRENLLKELNDIMIKHATDFKLKVQ